MSDTWTNSCKQKGMFRTVFFGHPPWIWWTISCWRRSRCHNVVPESRFPWSEMDLWQSHPVSASTICISPISGWLPADVGNPPYFLGLGFIPIVLRSQLQQMPCHTRHPICTSLLTSPVVVGQNPSLVVLIDIPPFLSISIHFYPFLSISWLAPQKKATHPEHVVSARFCVENMVGCLPIHHDPQSTINGYGQTGQNWTNWLCLKIG